jgi:molybdate-binding protein
VEAARSGARARIALLSERERETPCLVVAGCDPAGGLLAAAVEQFEGVEVVSAPASSRVALRWLKEGKVHVAGTHLEDAATGEFNLPEVRKLFRNTQMLLVTVASWEEGLVVAHGNPRHLKSAEDLAAPGVRIVNREEGSGSRALLDRSLRKAGIEPELVEGYSVLAPGHLAAAYAVAGGAADACVATRSAARAFGLDFVPWKRERYDFALRKETADSPAGSALLGVLQKASVRRKLEVLAGYDTAGTGRLIAV